MADITETLAPKTDQLDAIDLMGKPPQVFTVTKVDVKPNAEQPVAVHLAEFPRVWRPNVNMRRVLGFCWGRESDGWIGRRVELYCDEKVKFGNDTTGGTRISRVSHIDGPQTAPQMKSQGKPGTWTVEPITETEMRVIDLRAEYRTAAPERQEAIKAEVAELQKGGWS